MYARRNSSPRILPAWLDSTTLAQVTRIDVGLEGAWSETVARVWDPEGGFVGLPDDLPVAPSLRPCLELYMVEGWIGIHCFRRVAGGYELDRDRALALIGAVATAQRVGG